MTIPLTPAQALALQSLTGLPVGTYARDIGRDVWRELVARGLVQWVPYAGRQFMCRTDAGRAALAEWEAKHV